MSRRRAPRSGDACRVFETAPSEEHLNELGKRYF